MPSCYSQLLIQLQIQEMMQIYSESSLHLTHIFVYSSLEVLQSQSWTLCSSSRGHRDTSTLLQLHFIPGLTSKTVKEGETCLLIHDAWASAGPLAAAGCAVIMYIDSSQFVVDFSMRVIWVNAEKHSHLYVRYKDAYLLASCPLGIWKCEEHVKVNEK